MTGGAALWRLAWRNVRTSPLRHTLIVVLVGLAVAVAVSTAVVVRSTQLDAAERTAAEFGAAQLRIVSAPFGNVTYDDLPPALRAEVDARFGGPAPSPSPEAVEDAITGLLQDGISVVRAQRAFLYTPVDPVFGGTEVYAAEPSHPLLAPKFASTAPRPLAPGEAVLSPSLLDELDAAVGDTVHVPTVGDVRVVGEVGVAGPYAWNRTRVVVAPGTPLPAAPEDQWYLGDLAPSEVEAIAARLDRRLETLVRSTSAAPVAERFVRVDDPSWFDSSGRPGDRPSLVGAAVAAVLLVQVGFLSAAAFATGTRRRVREIGLVVVAAGASPEQVRALVRREAAVLGALGGSLGVLLAAVALATPAPWWFADVPTAGVEVAMADVLLPLLLAVVATVVAASVPARTVAAVPPVAALAGRVPTGRSPRWLVPVAALTLLVGIGAVAATRLTVSGAWTGGYRTATLVVLGGGWPLWGPGALLVVGVTLILVAVATLAGPLVGASGRSAGRLPLVARLAMRDAARQRTRSAAMVAATMVVLTVPVVYLTGVATGATARDDWQPPSAELVVIAGPYYADSVLSPTEDMVDAVRAAVAGADGAPDARRVVDEVTVPLLTDGSGMAWVTVSADDDPFATPLLHPSSVAVATPDLLAFVEVADLPANGAVVTGTDRSIQADLVGRVDAEGLAATGVPVTAAPMVVPDTGPQLLLGPDLADELGLSPIAELTLLRLDGPVTTALEQHLRAAGSTAPLPFIVDVQPPVDARTGLEPWLVALLVGVGTVLTLVVAVIVSALSATESDRDLRAMTAIGADPRLRPRLRAAQTAHLVALGAILAVPAGLTLVLTAHLADGFGARPSIPWAELALLVVAVPLLVALPFRWFSAPGRVHLAERRPT